MSWSSKDRKLGKIKVEVSDGRGSTESHYFHTMASAGDFYDKKVAELKEKAPNETAPEMAGLPRAYHVALVAREESIEIGVSGKEIDTSHLDSYAWNLLSHSKKAEAAAVEMQEALETAAEEVRDRNISVEDAIDEYLDALFEKYEKFGANDTEPRAIAERFLRDVA